MRFIRSKASVSGLLVPDKNIIPVVYAIGTATPPSYDAYGYNPSAGQLAATAGVVANRLLNCTAAAINKNANSNFMSFATPPSIGYTRGNMFSVNYNGEYTNSSMTFNSSYGLAALFIKNTTAAAIALSGQTFAGTSSTADAYNGYGSMWLATPNAIKGAVTTVTHTQAYQSSANNTTFSTNLTTSIPAGLSVGVFFHASSSMQRGDSQGFYYANNSTYGVQKNLSLHLRGFDALPAGLEIDYDMTQNALLRKFDTDVQLWNLT